MKSQFRDIFLKTATFGFKEETGSWEIDIGVADELSVNSLNSYVIDQVKIFLLAFHQLCKPVEICYDIITVDPNGKVKQVKEGQIRLIEEKSHAQVLQELKLSLENSEESFFTTIFIDCDLCVFVTEPEDKLNEDTLNQVLIPRAAKFYFGYVMEPKEDDEEALIPSDGSVSFETSVDIWVERTLDQLSLHWQDNYLYAAKNQPLLEEALRKWEIQVGKPIVEWNSRYYRDQIFKYGFK
ncbi:hypothetical protein WA1_47660 [Scytonema hofmannii PCC 7110]|uniref:Uncharacterized protein n=1 Tax=Scytonema hofmannii PCC 7110 TaxID=128403 RepID=A0A139WXX7_9CYAN|nr:hypothetical protein [Scytonema hofmannii]KYC37299.1 hypothetical protein WA1_47660 [Scytonema hofmannii PCC 7110]